MKPGDIDYAFYGRKSSESDERQIQSLDDQSRVCAKLADATNLRITQRFSEAKSAKEPGCRQAFQAMIEQLRAGKVQGIVCWKLDRLSRNPDEAGIVIGMLQRGEIRHIKTSERDYFSEDNTLMTYMEFGIANQAIRDLSKNVKRGLESKVEKGWRPGVAPHGYLNTRLAERGSNYIIVDDVRFPLLRRAWELMLTGSYVPEEVRERLNNDWGFRTRPTSKRREQPLSRSGIYSLLTNPFYAGIIAYGGSYEMGKHQPMVTVEEFDRVQFILGRAGKPRPTRHEYAFNGLVQCGECGGFVSATTKRKLRADGKLKTYILYYCTASRRGNCSQAYTNGELMERQISARLDRLTVPKVIIEWVLQLLRDEPDPAAAAGDAIQETLKRSLKDSERQLDVLTGLRIREVIDDEEFQVRRPALKAEIARLKGQLAQGDDVATARLEMTAETFRFAASARSRFKSGDQKVRREILTSVGWNYTLKDQKVSIEALPRYLVIEKRLPTVWRQLEALEPAKYGSDQWRKAAFAALRPILRGLVNAVGTAVRSEMQKACMQK